MKVPVCKSPIEHCPRVAMYEMVPSGVKFCNGSVGLSYYRNCEHREVQDIQFKCDSKKPCERNLRNEDGTCGIDSIMTSGCWLIGKAVPNYEPLVDALKALERRKQVEN